MTTFFLDVWQDLKRKRLLPVAALLAIAAVAVPIVLIRPVSDGGETGSGADAGAPTRPVVNPTEEPEAGSSDLDRFKAKNPFRSGSATTDEAETDSADSLEAGIGDGSSADGLSTGDEAAGGSVGSPSAGGGGDTSDSPHFAAPPGSGGESPAGGSGGSPGGGGGSGSPEARYFSYAVDVSYGRTGSTRAFDRVRVFDLLTERNPQLMFLGMAEDRERAGFSVLDPTLRDRGEGRCVKVRDGCSVLFLRKGQEHRFTDPSGDDEYRIRLLDVHEIDLPR